MATEYLDLGCTPSDEECAQVGHDNYPELSRLECRAYVAQLLRTFPNPPGNVRFVIRSNAHDFGSYLSVEVRYNTDSEAEVEYAFNVESNLPGNWDSEARTARGR